MASSYSAVVSADKLPKLTRDNFVTWKMYITAALQERELWSYVGGLPLVQPPSMPTTASTSTGSDNQSLATILKEVQDFINKDRKARAIIVLSVSEGMLIHTQPESMTAAQTWEKICAACQPKGMGTTYTLIRQLWCYACAFDSAFWPIYVGSVSCWRLEFCFQRFLYRYSS